VLQDLEEANAFVVSLDPARTWFRYHHLFAGLLQLELRRTAPAEVTGLHQAASAWFAAHGFDVEAVRHAQAARDWGLAARLLADHWPSLYLDGRTATVHALMAGFPAQTLAAEAELAAVAAGDELARGSLEGAERYLALAERGSTSEGRLGQALLGVVRLLLARQRGDLSAAAEQAQRLQALADALETAEDARAGQGEELRALALTSLGITEVLAARREEAERHLEQGIALARRVGRPFLEFTILAYQAVDEFYRSFPRATERCTQAIELAREHGWTDEPAAGIAYMRLGSVLVWQGRPEEAEPWVQLAERTIRAEAEPAAALGVHHVRGLLERARGRDADALAAFRAARRLAPFLAAPHLLAIAAQTSMVHTLVRLGDTARAEQALDELSDHGGDRGEVRVATAVLRLAQHGPHAATVALTPVLDGSAPVTRPTWLVHAFLLEAIARDVLGDPAAARCALERALDLAEPDGALLTFLLYPAPGLLERHARQRTAHAALITQILDLLAGNRPAPSSTGSRPPLEPLSGRELRVLRYLPTQLSAPEIATELSVSTSTVKTHMRHLYAKLGAHSRTEAVESARALALLAPSARSPAPA
jgi:LuxR family transcriptional regulator, maltose regulon positive regulatory protein